MLVLATIRYTKPYLYHLRTIFKYVIELAYIVNVSVDLIQGIKDMWDCLRIQTPRPLCPDKFYNMCQRVKSLYEAELPWMEDDQSPTLHKVWDHPREVLARLPDTLRLAMLEEGPLEGVKFSVSIVVSEGYGALTLLGLGLIKINDVSANLNNPRPLLILNK